MLSQEELLDQVQRNVEAARRIVNREQRLIAELEADGHDTAVMPSPRSTTSGISPHWALRVRLILLSRWSHQLSEFFG
jgi:hypothetical protein